MWPRPRPASVTPTAKPQPNLGAMDGKARIAAVGTGDRRCAQCPSCGRAGGGSDREDRLAAVRTPRCHSSTADAAEASASPEASPAGAAPDPCSLGAAAPGRGRGRARPGAHPAAVRPLASRRGGRQRGAGDLAGGVGLRPCQLPGPLGRRASALPGQDRRRRPGCGAVGAQSGPARTVRAQSGSGAVSASKAQERLQGQGRRRSPPHGPPRRRRWNFMRQGVLGAIAHLAAQLLVQGL